MIRKLVKVLHFFYFSVCREIAKLRTAYSYAICYIYTSVIVRIILMSFLLAILDLNRKNGRTKIIYYLYFIDDAKLYVKISPKFLNTEWEWVRKYHTDWMNIYIMINRKRTADSGRWFYGEEFKKELGKLHF